MPDNATKMQPTLGLTGLTMNAMALIAPGAFLWLTFFLAMPRWRNCILELAVPITLPNSPF